MSQKIADLESYYLIKDSTIREVFRQAFENQRILQTQLVELKTLIAEATDLPSLQQALASEES